MRKGNKGRKKIGREYFSSNFRMYYIYKFMKINIEEREETKEVLLNASSTASSL